MTNTFKIIKFVINSYEKTVKPWKNNKKAVSLTYKLFVVTSFEHLLLRKIIQDEVNFDFLTFLYSPVKCVLFLNCDDIRIANIKMYVNNLKH